jgi:hypothetical protein
MIEYYFKMGHCFYKLPTLSFAVVVADAVWYVIVIILSNIKPTETCYGHNIHNQYYDKSALDEIVVYDVYISSNAAFKIAVSTFYITYVIW